MSKVPLIAIVDDDASFRRAASNFVRSLGYCTEAFESAEAFMQSDRIDDTDCLIADVQMPGTTGIELQSELIARRSRLPVIFVTAFPEKEVRGRALAAGAVGFLEKPFNDQKLIGCLTTALAARGE